MANPAGLKAALLDFDQTLVDLPVDWDTLRSGIAALFKPYGINSTMRPLLASIRGGFAELERQGLPPAERGALRRRVNRVLREAEMKAAASARPMPGASELLKTLRLQGMKVVIQSSNSVDAIRHALGRLELPDVDDIAGRESGRRPKPDPQAVRAALRRMGLRGEECVVIGDGDFDVELGRAIGAMTVRIGQGREPADHYVSSLNEASRLLFGRQPRAA